MSRVARISMTAPPRREDLGKRHQGHALGRREHRHVTGAPMLAMHRPPVMAASMG